MATELFLSRRSRLFRAVPPRLLWLMSGAGGQEVSVWRQAEGSILLKLLAKLELKGAIAKATAPI